MTAGVALSSAVSTLDVSPFSTPPIIWDEEPFSTDEGDGAYDLLWSFPLISPPPGLIIPVPSLDLSHEILPRLLGDSGSSGPMPSLDP